MHKYRFDMRVRLKGHPYFTSIELHSEDYGDLTEEQVEHVVRKMVNDFRIWMQEVIEAEMEESEEAIVQA